MLTQSQTDIANIALMQLGQRTIQSLADQNDTNARAANVAWNLALGTVSRETPWNCLKKRVALEQLAPAPDSPAGEAPPPPASPSGGGFSSGFSSGFSTGSGGGGGGGGNPSLWAPNTNYAVNDLVIFGAPVSSPGPLTGYQYQCLIANTSGESFPEDLTRGYWFQNGPYAPNFPSPTAGNASRLYEWTFAYALPTDFILLIELNGQNVFYDGGGNTFGSLYEIYQNVLYCDTQMADIKYNKFEPDTTLYDTMFIDALVYKLASLMATTLRKDNADLSFKMAQMYQAVVTRARVKNGNEANSRRYSVVSQSRFIGARRWSTNG